MSSNIAMLMLGMIVAGRLTDVVGARWIWGAAAVAAWVAAIAGYALSRRVAPPAVQTEALPVTAHAAESVQR
jgi:MFS family permease